MRLVPKWFAQMASTRVKMNIFQNFLRVLIPIFWSMCAAITHSVQSVQVSQKWPLSVCILGGFRQTAMTHSKEEQQIEIKFLIKQGKSKAEVVTLMQAVNGANCLSHSSISRWYDRIQNDLQATKDRPKSSAPKVRMAQKVAAVRQTVLQNRRQTVRQVAAQVNATTDRMLWNDLEMRKTSAKWIPHLLTDPEKQRCVLRAGQSLQMIRAHANPIRHIVAEDESWIFCWDPESKQASMQCLDWGEPHPEKVRLEMSMQHLMLVVFFDEQGVIFQCFVPHGLGIRGQLYWEILTQFLHAMCWRRPLLWRDHDCWALLHDETPAHCSRPVVTLLCNTPVRVLPHPGYSPDLSLLDYWFFAKVKKAVRCVHHRNLDALKASVDAAIAAIPQAEFQEAMERYPQCLRKCIQAHRNYFEQDWLTSWKDTDTPCGHVCAIWQLICSAMDYLNCDKVLRILVVVLMCQPCWRKLNFTYFVPNE